MKQGFVVYFDNCRQTRDLADHHYATLWRTLFTYAEKLAQDDGGAETYLSERITTAPGGVGMAMRFVADNIRRDHQRYQARTAQYRAAQERGGEKGEKQTQKSAWGINEEMLKYIGGTK